MTTITHQTVSHFTFRERLRILFKGWVTVDSKLYTNTDNVQIFKSEAIAHAGVKGDGKTVILPPPSNKLGGGHSMIPLK